jgi:PAS domain S-box-containing protein
LSGVAAADREWERQCGDLARLASDWLWEMDAELRISYISERLRWIMDVDPAFFVGKHRSEYMDPSTDDAELAVHMENLRARRPIRSYVYGIETPSGRRYVKIDGDPVFDSSGKFLGYRGIGTQITAQVRAEEKASRSFRQLVDAVESLPVGLAQYDSDHRLLFWNGAYAATYPWLVDILEYGVSYQCIIRRLVDAGALCDDIGDPDAWIAANIAARKARQQPFELGLSDGRWIRVSYHSTLGGGTISIHADITESKRREEALQQSERLFHLAFEQGPGMSAISEVKTGQHVAVGIWADFKTRAKAIALLEKHGRFKDFEGQYRTREGEIRDFLISAEMIEIQGESHMLITGHDITERKRVESKLRESEARLSGILRISPEAVIVIDGEQKITLFNEGAERLFGYKVAEAIGQPIDMLIPPPHRAAHRRHIREFRESPVGSKLMSARQEIGGLAKDGSIFPAEASISKLELRGQTLFTVLLHDITERKKAERMLLAAKEEAESASRAKSEFLANMSHELRTPLNAILGFSEVIRNQVLGEIGVTRYLEYADDIHRSGEHLLEIISDILDVARIDAGQASLEEETVEMEYLIDSSLLVVRERAEQKDLHLTVQVESGIHPLQCDRRKMKQVIINLLSNAVKFSEAGGRITVGAWSDARSKETVIEVRDSGIGISEEDIPRVLEPFTQTGSSFTREHEGTGLGLPLARKLTELHGGRIEMESVLGEGTTVRVRLPTHRIVRKKKQPSLSNHDG